MQIVHCTTPVSSGKTWFIMLSKSPSLHSLPTIPWDAHTEHFLHITGEVTNPVLLENFVTEHPMVQSAIMFGHGRYSAGILIELKDDFKIDRDDPNQVERAINQLRPAIKRMNMFAPQHARVPKEMILFAASTKPFIYSSSRVNRRETLAEYISEINALYKTMAQTTHVALDPPKVWSPDNSLVYVRAVVITVLGKKLDDDADIFYHGTNSLLATRIRIILFQALQTTAKVDTRKFSGDILYKHSTIASLAAFATRTALADFYRRTESHLARCFEMINIVQSYSMDFPIYRPSITQPGGDVILITGTTGLFGSNLLARFLQNPKVKEVYALNRRKIRASPVVEGQAFVLESCGLDPALARHPKLTLLETDASQCQLGLVQELYEELLSSVTHIVHNAWLYTCDDNLSLKIFDSNFHILRNLIDFALCSPHLTPPRLLFISTTDTLRSAPTSSLKFRSESKEAGSIGSECPLRACDAAGSTYGESKWVGEQILATAALETPLRPISIRVGPLCGATNGCWREDALLPMIVHLSIALGALPQVDEVVHWVPVHIAAQAVTGMRHSTSAFLHVTHPHPVSSLVLLRCIGTELCLPLLPLPQWTTLLEERVHTTGCASPVGDPALTVLQHIHRARAQDPIRVFEHVPAAARDAGSASLPWHGMDALGVTDVRCWLQHWRETGIIPSDAS